MTARNVLVTGRQPRYRSGDRRGAMSAAGHTVLITNRSGEAPDGLTAVQGDVTGHQSPWMRPSAAEEHFGGPVEVVVITLASPRTAC